MIKQKKAAQKHGPEGIITMAVNQNSQSPSRARRLARLYRMPNSEFRRASKSELLAAGHSEKSERYVLRTAKRITSRTLTLSKRQFAQKKLSEGVGRKVTLEERAREYLAGQRQAKTAKDAEMRAKSIEFWALKKKYPGEKIGRIREHKKNMMIKASGDQLEYEVYLREKAFAEAHISIPEERDYYQQWFNYGHVKKTATTPNQVSR